MRLIRLYCDPKMMGLHTGFAGELDPRNTHYLKNVLRASVGQPLELFDGVGNEFSAKVSLVERRKVEVQVGESKSRIVSTESPLDICLAIGISKGDRMDWVMQKATELGANRICPISTQHCDVKFNESRLNKKLDHWHNVVISASEQSQRLFLPVVERPQTFSEFVGREGADLCLLFDPGGKPLAQLAANRPTPKSVTVGIGPEGGFSAEELEMAIARGFELSIFGPRILRTETAPVACLAVLQYLWGDC